MLLVVYATSAFLGRSILARMAIVSMLPVAGASSGTEQPLYDVVTLPVHPVRLHARRMITSMPPVRPLRDKAPTPKQ